MVRRVGRAGLRGVALVLRVDRRLAAAQDVAVHDVVVDQQAGLQEFHGRARAVQHAGHRRVGRFGRAQLVAQAHQDAPDHFAGAGVGFQPLGQLRAQRADGSQLRRVFAQDVADRLLEAGADVLEIRKHGRHPTSSSLQAPDDAQRQKENRLHRDVDAGQPPVRP